jgi:hypothetical protein
MVTVPYIPAEEIECDAEALLVECQRTRGIVIEPPIPIDDIIEKYLKLGIEFDDMHRLLGVPRSGLGLFPDILGGMFFNARRIVIDESLDPEVNPSQEPRYRNTAAHEVGHWREHGDLFGGLATPVVCRTSRAKDRVEWQANFYASCLLMPRTLVYAAWDRMAQHFIAELPPTKRQLAGADCPEEVTSHIVLDLARHFLVSYTAMHIRLEKLRLIPAEPRHQQVVARAV